MKVNAVACASLSEAVYVFQLGSNTCLGSCSLDPAKEVGDVTLGLLDALGIASLTVSQFELDVITCEVCSDQSGKCSFGINLVQAFLHLTGRLVLWLPMA